MESMQIKATQNSPEVIFNAELGAIKISGRSFPENTVEFYNRIEKLIDDYLAGSTNEITIEFDFSYISSTSISAIYRMLHRLKEHTDNGKELKLIWKYEKDEEGISELGEKFASSLGLPVQVAQKN